MSIRVSREESALRVTRGRNARLRAGLERKQRSAAARQLEGHVGDLRPGFTTTRICSGTRIRKTTRPPSRRAPTTPSESCGSARLEHYGCTARPAGDHRRNDLARCVRLTNWDAARVAALVSRHRWCSSEKAPAGLTPAPGSVIAALIIGCCVGALPTGVARTVRLSGPAPRRQSHPSR
jgi:hypothetical protein